MTGGGEGGKHSIEAQPAAASKAHRADDREAPSEQRRAARMLHSALGAVRHPNLLREALAASDAAYGVQEDLYKKHKALVLLHNATERALSEWEAPVLSGAEALREGDAAYGAGQYRVAAEGYRRARLEFDKAYAISPEPPPPPVDELANARAVAKEWLAGTTALFGLFSLGGFIFARDALEGLPSWGQALIAVAALLAVAAAGGAIFFGNRAAHGWLRKGERAAEAAGRDGPDGRKARDSYGLRRQAEQDHFTSVVAAGVALAMLVLAVGGICFGQASVDVPGVNIRVQKAGESLVCGTLVELLSDRVTVRDRAGADEDYLLVNHTFDVTNC